MSKRKIIDSRPANPGEAHFRYRRYEVTDFDDKGTVNRFSTYEYTEEQLAVLKTKAEKYDRIVKALSEVEE